MPRECTNQAAPFLGLPGSLNRTLNALCVPVLDGQPTGDEELALVRKILKLLNHKRPGSGSGDAKAVEIDLDALPYLGDHGLIRRIFEGPCVALRPQERRLFDMLSHHLGSDALRRC
jgi:hypothetical protein